MPVNCEHCFYHDCNPARCRQGWPNPNTCLTGDFRDALRQGHCTCNDMSRTIDYEVAPHNPLMMQEE